MAISQTTCNRYALRKLYYFERVKRQDLAIRFDLSQSTAQRRLKDFRTRFGEFILADSEKVLRYAGSVMASTDVKAEYPQFLREVSGRDILEEIWRPARDIENCLFDLANAKITFQPEHLHYMVDHLAAGDLPEDVDFNELVRALLRTTAVEVDYVSLKAGKSRERRLLFPMILRIFGDQISVSAFDVKDLKALKTDADWARPPMKTFVLFRILHIRRIAQTPELQCLSSQIASSTFGRDADIRYRVILNPRLTADQKLAVSRELGLSKDGCKSMDSALRFHFETNYMADRVVDGAALSHNVEQVWPLVVGIEEA